MHSVSADGDMFCVLFLLFIVSMALTPDRYPYNSVGWCLETLFAQITWQTGIEEYRHIHVYTQLYKVGVQRYTTYREYRETAVQDTYRDTKKLIKIRTVTIYYTLLYFNFWK